MFREARKKCKKSPDSTKIEVHEDEEQIVKFEEIVEILVIAGYYRARIKGLSSFDKIIGGMTWCIESCFFGVEIDLLFQENLTIGQKIALTEKIVVMLPKMNCPYQIEPHQIQGLDYIHIFPVIKWLVEQSMRTRREMEQYVRLFAIDQFHRKYNYNPSTEKMVKRVSTQHIISIKEAYDPRRYFCQQNIIPIDEFSVVSNTILEYGEILRISESVTIKIQESKLNSSRQDTEITKEMVERKFQEKCKVEQLMKNLSKLDNELNLVSWDLVGKMINIQVQEISIAVKQFISSSRSQFEDNKTPIISLVKQIFILKNQKEKLLLHKQKFNREMHNLKSHLQEIQEEKQAMTLKIIKNIQSHGNKKLLFMLKELLIVYDVLRDQQNRFRECCRIDLVTFRKLVESIDKEKPCKGKNCIFEYENQKEIISLLRLQLAKKNRLIATLKRQLDDIPGRSELFQYQQRFMELYNQVSTKHKETKQYYTLYNTLDDTKMYLNKELCLLNSIQDNYIEAMVSSNGREQFIKQFELIVDGVKRNKMKIQNRCTEEKNQRDIFSHQLVTLMDQQRKYIAAVRQLTVECRKNEILLAQLRGP